jgi:hypothetical protein
MRASTGAAPWNQPPRRTTIVSAMTILPELADHGPVAVSGLFRSSLTPMSRAPHPAFGRPLPEGEGSKYPSPPGPLRGPRCRAAVDEGALGERVTTRAQRCTNARNTRKTCHFVPLFETPVVTWQRSWLIRILFSHRKIRRNDRTGWSSKDFVATSAAICQSEIGLMFTSPWVLGSLRRNSTGFPPARGASASPAEGGSQPFTGCRVGMRQNAS